MEDEGNHGNDDTRCFILSTLAGQHKSRVTCALCEETMYVFDRYPLVDGTFFLSPMQHTKGAVEVRLKINFINKSFFTDNFHHQVKVEGRIQFLTCVCMGCLEKCPPERAIRCRFCGQKWDGSSLVLGTMYSYDIFMATPCCTERLKVRFLLLNLVFVPDYNVVLILQCNSCYKPLLHPQQRLNFYSDYSHTVSCPHCHVVDTHFVKPLSYCFTKQPFPLYQQWP
jgi:headcase protein